MAKKYQIEVEEILQKVFEIEADSLEKAIDIAHENYRNDEDEYILDHDNFKELNIREYKDEIIKNKSKKQMER